MASVIEKEGKTISEAVLNACEELGVSKEEVEIEVIREDSKGVLGIGSRNAIVRAEIKTGGLSEKAFRAKKTLETVLGFLFSIPQSVKTEETDSKIILEVWNVKDKKLLVGKNGEVIKSLEYIIGKIASKNSDEGKNKRVAINIGGHGSKKTDSAKRKSGNSSSRGSRRKSSSSPKPEFRNREAS
ncbi:MAG: Jag N-terminal domain-containing protein [Candidatus Dadabacteria bacterium]|nr:Jag N-terminal domain-containing protein [Candidatus Dadabacteria bacterium]MCY4262810.1 Jag N-terminal domain-containing protein [Candidatus Dadabacteria bacterium]